MRSHRGPKAQGFRIAPVACKIRWDGFLWGPLQVIRALQGRGYVMVNLCTERRNIEVVAYEGGDVRLWMDGIEMVLPLVYPNLSKGDAQLWTHVASVQGTVPQLTDDADDATARNAGRRLLYGKRANQRGK